MSVLFSLIQGFSIPSAPSQSIYEQQTSGQKNPQIKQGSENVCKLKNDVQKSWKK